MRVLDDPLPELLEAFIEGPGTISTRFSNDGISHISGSYNNEIRHESIMISLDTAKGYRLVSWKNKMGYPKEPKCHNLAYRAQQLRAFKKPEKAREKISKKRYTKEDWLKEAKAFLEKIKSKRKSDSVSSGF